MAENLLSSLLQNTGAAGAIVAGVGFVIRYLQQRIDSKDTALTTAQDKRVTDAQAAAAKVMELVQKQHEQMALLATALNDIRDTIADMSRGLETRLEADRERGDPDRQRRSPPVQPRR